MDLQYTHVAKVIRRARREFESYILYAKALSFAPSEEEVAKFRLVWAELRELLTNSPTGNPPNAPLMIVKGRIQLSPGRLVEIEEQIDEGKTILFNVEKNIIVNVSTA